ncbi:MAG: hypothetical protein RL223_2463 [Pseudomonadota bacterium]|jgi:hypothetical protein
MPATVSAAPLLTVPDHPLLLDPQHARAGTPRALPDEVDVLVVGAGAAGLAAALAAAIDGARVLLIERTGHVGGTSAWSGGTTWVPLTAQGLAANPADDRAQVDRYLDAAVGDHAPRALRQAFLDHGPGVIAHLERQGELRWRPYARHPDYLSELPGSTLHGRALEPLPFDGRSLGALLAILRPPIPEFTVLGGMMVDRNDIHHLLNLRRSWVSLRHAVRLLGRHAIDRLSRPRGTRLVMGNALIGRFLASLAARRAPAVGGGAGFGPGVRLALGTVLARIDGRDGAAEAGPCTVELHSGPVRHRLCVRGGIVLASGGFNRHPQRRAALLPGIAEAWCPGAPGHGGQAQDAALAVGAQFEAAGHSPAFWAPVSLRRRADGSTAVFPHFLMDRAKPGFVAVDGRGERFVNEATSYHLFGMALQGLRPGSAGAAGGLPPLQSAQAWLICDAQALQRYGIGLVRPGGQGLAPFLADGYLQRADTPQDLARRLHLPEAALARTLAQMNAAAASGHDARFHRGETDYQRHMGDATRGLKNPNLGPIGPGPFYAVRLQPGDIGASAGLRTDDAARLLDAAGRPLPGLWAVGNDAASIMGGIYTGPGITLGPGIVFGTLAGRAAAERAARFAAAESGTSDPAPAPASTAGLRAAA